MVNRVSMVVLMSLFSGTDEAAWVVKAQTAEVTVFSRARGGSDLQELKAVGIISSSAETVFRVLTDYARYHEIMPYTEASRVIDSEENGRVVHFYSLVNAPMASKRDYTIRIVNESNWREGKGSFKTRWTVSDKGPAPINGVVRVKVNEGSWLLEPLENGAKTRATYVLCTDPGGALPTWLANKANRSTLPDVFRALAKHARDPQYAGR